MKAAEYAFFSSTHGTFPRIDHMLGHKVSLSRRKKTDILSSNFSEHNAMRLEISYKKKTAKHTNVEEKNESMYIFCVTDEKQQNYSSHGVQFSQ